MQELEKPRKEYLERVPYVTELLRVIDSINQSIRLGFSGINETQNLISDLPDSFFEGIKDDYSRFEKKYNIIIDEIERESLSGRTRSTKEIIYARKLRAGQEFSRAVKQRVITLLDSKNMLFLTRRAADVGYMKYEGNKEDE